jgi:hypothetical protein
MAVGGALALLVFWRLRGADEGTGKERPRPIEVVRTPAERPRSPVGREEAPPEAPRGSASVTPTRKAEVDRLIASIDWPAYGCALLAYLRMGEDSRRKHTEPEFDRETMEVLSKANRTFEELSRLLGIQDPRDVRYQEEIAPHFEAGWLKALGINLTPEKEKDFEGLARAFSRSRASELEGVKGANRLERLTWEAERGLLWDQEVSKVLDPEQLAAYSQPSGQDPFWGREVEHREVRSDGVVSTARVVEEFWAETFRLGETTRPVLAEAASRYAGEVQRRIDLCRAQCPGGVPRGEAMRLKVDLVRLQAAAERELARSLPLNGVSPDRLKEGSGVVLDFGRE